MMTSSLARSMRHMEPPSSPLSPPPPSSQIVNPEDQSLSTAPQPARKRTRHSGNTLEQGEASPVAKIARQSDDVKELLPRKQPTRATRGRAPAAAEPVATVATVIQTMPAKLAAAAARKAKAASKRWNAIFVTQDMRSPLRNVDLRALLSMPEAWDCLPPDDKKEILAQFPDNEHILCPGTDEAAPNVYALRNNDSFRHDASTYTEHLRMGMHEQQWLDEAWLAHGRRAAGHFDAFELETFEKDWNVKLSDQISRDNAALMGNDEDAEKMGDDNEMADTPLANGGQAHAMATFALQEADMPPNESDLPTVSLR